MNNLIEKAKAINCLICDVDGVLTDALVYFSNSGEEIKSFNIQDGMGIKLLMAAGIEIAVITTSVNPLIDHRVKQLGIKHYYKGQVDKRESFEQLKANLGFSLEEFAYVGDDLPDLAIIKQVGLGVAVASAVPQVKEFAAWVTEKPGGHGAVREVCDLILTAKDKHQEALDRYLTS